MKRIKFIFDLDGTITAAETLPMIAERFGVREQITELTAQTVRGTIPFVESFIRRVTMLGGLPVSQVADLLASVPMHEELLRFIREHRENCVVATGNLECWSHKLLERIGCESYCSTSEVEDDRVVRLTRILRKEDIVERYRAEGWETVFIGDGNNDLEAMRVADIAIAVGMTHEPSPSILPATDYLIYDQKALCRQLEILLGFQIPKDSKSVIVSCAGIGSRLGLGQTKALIDIHGRSMIAWQLEMFREVADLRIVVGYQAGEVVAEVRKYRSDVTFVYNHRYFETKTGASFWLGARHANEYAIEWDGDLLVHPDDVRMLLAIDGEYICYAEKASEESVFVTVDQRGEVLSFSREQGDYEWTGPACIHRDRLNYSSGNVFNQLEPYLPMRGVKVRAYDIDTYQDYENVLRVIAQWNL